MNNQIKDHFLYSSHYNADSNQMLFDLLAGLSEEQLHEDCGSWFESLFKLLNHVLLADLIWLTRFEPVFPSWTGLDDQTLFPEDLSWKKQLAVDFAELRQKRILADKAIILWFQQLDPEAYNSLFHYTDSSGSVHKAQAWKAFDYLFLHQNHHRGQISQILDSWGIVNNFADNKLFLERE